MGSTSSATTEIDDEPMPQAIYPEVQPYVSHLLQHILCVLSANMGPKYIYNPPPPPKYFLCF